MLQRWKIHPIVKTPTSIAETQTQTITDEYEMSISYNTFPAETSYLMGCDQLHHHWIWENCNIQIQTFK